MNGEWATSGQDSHDTSRAPAFTRAMRHGAAVYTDAIAALRGAGIPAEFTQTGGMCAAIDAVLDGGAVLLVTDSQGPLCWDRTEQQGWSASITPRDSYDNGSCDHLAYADTTDSSTTALLALVRAVLTAARPAAGAA